MHVEGHVRVPGDKSLSHRALILASLASGTSRIHGLLRSADIESTATALRALGCPIPPIADQISIRGGGVRGLAPPTTELECGNSGTTVRLLAGAVAGHPFSARFTGDRSLSRRPMRRVADPLRRMGAGVTFDNADGLPFTVQGGSLRPTEWRSAVSSAQVKSAILLAGLTAGVEVTVNEPTRSRDHTERMLRAQGVQIISDTADASGYRVTLQPASSITPLDLTIPGDPSSAAFAAALAAIGTRGTLTLSNVLWNETRTGFFRALQRMGVHIVESDVREWAGEQVVGKLHVTTGMLRGIEIAPTDVTSMIDELPVLACVAACAEGETIVTGASELRAKESDRIASMVANLRRIGADATELADGFRIIGSDKPLRGEVITGGDHRVAMAFGVLAAHPRNAIEIDDRSCVAVSYPDFWSEMKRLVMH